MADETVQLSTWRGDFGDTYTGRNEVSEEAVRQRVRAWSRILDHLPGGAPRTILEVGANIGINLRALGRLSDARLIAVEPNAAARERLIADGVVREEDALNGQAAALPLADASADLVFTSGVLIHLPEEQLPAAYAEMHRVSGRHIACLEYFAPTATAIPYHGRDDLLFKRDFGGLWLDMFPELELVADGFFWKRTTGLDNLNWWLFRKP